MKVDSLRQLAIFMPVAPGAVVNAAVEVPFREFLAVAVILGVLAVIVDLVVGEKANVAFDADLAVVVLF